MPEIVCFEVNELKELIWFWLISGMCEFCEATASERETIGQRYAIACAVVNSLLVYMHACMHFL